MRFEHAQRIAAPLADAMAALADPSFVTGRTPHEGIGRPELVAHEVDGHRVCLSVRFAFTGELNAAARALLDPSRLTWVQVSNHDLDTNRVVFHLEPDHYADRLTCKGRYLISPDPDDANACLRRVQGEVKVRAPLVAAQVERVLVSGMRDELDAQAGELPGWIARS